MQAHQYNYRIAQNEKENIIFFTVKSICSSVARRQGLEGIQRRPFSSDEKICI